MRFTNMTDFWATINEYACREKRFKFIINYECNEAFFCDCENEKDAKDFFVEINSEHKHNACLEKLEILSEDFEKYKKSFNLAQEKFLTKEVKVINLTMATPIYSKYRLEEIFALTSARYKVYLPNRFVCFSPEPFIKIDKTGKIFCTPMKGTISASIPNAANLILENKKEINEHNAVIEVTKQDLQTIADEVNVTRYRYIDVLKTSNGDLLQVSSEVSAKLNTKTWKKNLGNLIQRILPASSISGVPKKSAIDLIKVCETNSRGFYTGICGVFDGSSLDTGVMIRFIAEDKKGQKFFYSGGGITVESDCKKEYGEVLEKIYFP
ncbi:MAG: aminodeoxychorismate synthase component I [Treponemataceae bacterium]